MIEVQERLRELLEEVIQTALSSADPTAAALDMIAAVGTVIRAGQSETLKNHDAPQEAQASRDNKRVSYAHGSIARRHYAARRIRDRIFDDPDLFGEPAWDILLDLFAAELRGEAISITSACIASGVPSTTALRWVGLLEAKGYVERKPDPVDARRSFVGLTLRGRNILRQCFQGFIEHGLAGDMGDPRALSSVQ